MRDLRSVVSRTCCFSSMGTSTFAAMRSARCPGWVIDSTSSVAAAGSSGMSSITSRASFFRLIASASTSTSSVVLLSSTGSTRALRYGLSWTSSRTLNRARPCTTSE